MASTVETIYFWRETEAAGGFMSQWFSSPFQDAENPDPKRIYNTAEHYMMYHKAMLFNDGRIAAQILATDSPRTVRTLGRKVQNFDEQVWAANRDRIVRQGNICKFTCGVSGAADFSSPSLKELLLATGNKELVEASPYDRIWGIGFGAKTAPNHRDQWGENRLGKALMEVRAELQKDKDAEAAAARPGD